MTDPALDRRELLADAARGLAGLALLDLLGRDGYADVPRPHHPPRARSVIQLCMSGAASQVDLFDHKPLLSERAGEPFDPGGTLELFQSQAGVVMPSPWRFRPRGECGKWTSDLVPRIGACADRIAFVHSLTSRTNVHGPATFLQTTGFDRPGFPAAGAWASYALGSANDDLPTFVSLPDPRGYAPNGPKNWGAGFLPATHQATTLDALSDAPLANLHAPAEAPTAPRDAETAARRIRERLDLAYAQRREQDSRLDARVRAYELAARLQTSAPEALDVERESPATRVLYGLDDPVTAELGRRCLVARRLIERGVRYVQIWSGADNGFPRRNWDSHEELERDHGDMGRSMDGPVAALLLDLEARGLLSETVLFWTTEFGRMPCAQGARGRDHNPDGFSAWLAGGGVRPATTVGATDEWGWRAAERELTYSDLFATLLHLLGYDPERLSVRHTGIDRRLADVTGRVVPELLA